MTVFSFRRALALVSAIVVIVGGLFALERVQIRRTAARGNRVVRALEQYKLDHGHFPSSLDLLTPRYVDQIPLPTWGSRQWKYFMESSDRYELSAVPTPGDWSQFYYTRTREWCGWTSDP